MPSPSVPPPAPDEAVGPDGSAWPGPTEAQLHRRALWVLGVLIAVVLTSVGYVLYARGAFEPEQRLVLLADDAEGVTVGMDLMFAGFPIGRVERLSLGDDGQVRIRVAVPRKNAHWLRTSSVVTLERSLVGGSRLRAFSGVMTDPPLAPDATLPVLKGDALAELPALMASVRDILGHVERLTAPDSALSALLGHARTVAGRAAGPQGGLAALLGSDAAASALLGRVDTVVQRTDRLLQRLDAVALRTDGVLAGAQAQVLGPEGLSQEAKAVATELRQVLTAVQHTLSRTDALLADAQAVAGQARVASDDLGALRAEVEASLRAMQGLLTDVQRRWPLAREPQVVLP